MLFGPRVSTLCVVSVVLFILLLKCHWCGQKEAIMETSYLLQMKPHDLWFWNQARTHTTQHHTFSSCCHKCIYVTFTSKKGAGYPAASHRLIDVTVNESVPVYQGLSGECVKEAILNPKVMKFVQNLIMKRQIRSDNELWMAHSNKDGFRMWAR